MKFGKPKKIDRIKGDLEFCGYGCDCFDKKGKSLEHPKLALWDDVEQMIEQAYSDKKVHSLHIYKSYRGNKDVSIYNHKKGQNNDN